MALSANQKAELEQIIQETGTHRVAWFKERIIPEEYKACLEQVERTEVTLPVPKVNVAVKCFISTAKKTIPNCPVHINIHGGGFYLPHSENDTMYCSQLAVGIKGIVVDVDYALCPQYAFPVALEQCYAVAQWVFSQCEAWGSNINRISIGGHSAGGNLAAAVSLKAAKSKDFRFCLQVLDYAAMDFATDPLEKPGGQERMMPVERERAFSTLYVDGDETLLHSPYVSPCMASDEVLKNLPEALIISGGKCNFRYENEEYGLRLVSAGVEVTMRRFLQSRHAFTVLLLDEWRDSQSLIIRSITNANLGHINEPHSPKQD